MDMQELHDALAEVADPQQAGKMRAYLRDQFEFLGVAAPLRRKVTKPLLREARQHAEADWEFLGECWDHQYREFQYVAADYLHTVSDILAADALPRIKKLVTTKSWWDTVDALHGVVGTIALKHRDATETILEWSQDENFWVRRIAIDHQLGRKELTDKELLATILKNNFGSDEFFINKAIGWALRDYSKINPIWVRAFIDHHQDQMAALSVREGGKYC